ncbi:hypothetical protein SB11R_03720 [Pseudomonas oryzihabitans]|nr:hypothetical protein SB11R_03720 [Pseudomonas psychrotolerans]
MNDTLDHHALATWMKAAVPPCLSLYLPTERAFPQREQNVIRFKNLLRTVEADVRQRFPEADTTALLAPLTALIDDADFWNHPRGGLIILRDRDHLHLLKVAGGVPETAMVNHHFHLQPLLQLAQTTGRYQVLCLSRDHARLFEGSRDNLVEVELAEGVPRTLEEALGTDLTEGNQRGLPQGFGRASERGDAMQHNAGGISKHDEQNVDRERYFLALDRALTREHSQPSKLPLLLAALPEHQAVFRRISNNPLLLAEGLAGDPGPLDNDTLREKAWAVMEPHLDRHLGELLGTYAQRQGQGLASDRLEEIGGAVLDARVATLLVEADRRIPGHLDFDRRLLVPSDPAGANTEDLLDELSLQTLQQGGQVLVLPRERMPGKTGAAAIYRF